MARQRQLRVGAGISAALFTDNLPLLSALCNGSSSVVNFGTVVHAMLLQVAAYRLLAWYEHVDSEANVADGGSRLGVEDPLARSLGVTLREVPVPPWPVNVRDAPAQAWLDMLRGPEAQGAMHIGIYGFVLWRVSYESIVILCAVGVQVCSMGVLGAHCVLGACR